MKVLIFGSGGYLGRYFVELYPGAVTPSVDIADPFAVSEVLDRGKPDVVINCAGKTGKPNVDWCEMHREETLRSNVLGPLVLREECGKRGMYWVHLGSGCIYDGDNDGKGFSEEDVPNFTGSFYSRTKLWSDQILKEFPVLNVRLRMPFDSTRSPRNLLMKLRNYSRVLDEPNSITYVPDLLSAVSTLISRRSIGTFNVVNDEAISPYAVMQLYTSVLDPTHKFERLTLADLATVVRTGRSNCVLSNAKLHSEGIAMRNVKEAVRDAFSKFQK